MCFDAKSVFEVALDVLEDPCAVNEKVLLNTAAEKGRLLLGLERGGKENRVAKAAPWLLRVMTPVSDEREDKYPEPKSMREPSDDRETAGTGTSGLVDWRDLSGTGGAG